MKSSMGDIMILLGFRRPDFHCHGLIHDTQIWQMYYHRQLMLATRRHLITPLIWGLYLCIYFGIINVQITYEFGLMIQLLYPLILNSPQHLRFFYMMPSELPVADINRAVTIIVSEHSKRGLTRLIKYTRLTSDLILSIVVR